MQWAVLCPLLIVRTIIFRSEKCNVVLDRLQVFYPRLVLDCTEDFVDGEPQRVKCSSAL